MSHARHNSLSPIKRALITIDRLQKKIERLEQARRAPIAIVGMAGRFPGASDVEAFWRLLRTGREGVGDPPPGRFRDEDFQRLGLSPSDPRFVRRAGYLKDIDRFDPGFFGISPREAAQIDPQHRLLLETAYEALEDAGMPLARAGGNTGVYIGIITEDYRQALLSRPEWMGAYAATGIARGAASGRLSYFLDARGPCVALDSACASSLSAIHQACGGLQAGECDLALAGGVNLILSPLNTLLMQRLNALAPDARCKTFDARANGYVRGEGCGVLALKRLADAERDGDRIHALIRGSAENQDGRSNGFTAPNGLAQADVARRALDNAGVKPEEVTFVETHGTGTALGDPIEVEALQAVYGEGPPLTLGAVKTNIGHLESAAGVAGVVKVALSLKHRQIPPNLNLESLSPHLSLDGGRFHLPTRLAEWPSRGGPRLAGVSAFGINGCNVHVILEEYNAQPNARVGVGWRKAEEPLALPLSARDPEALRVLAERYRHLLTRTENRSYAMARAICRQTARRRTHHPLRAVAVGASSEALARQCAALAEGGDAPRHGDPAESGSPLAFVLSGQSVGWHPLSKELPGEDSAFGEALVRCHELFRKLGGWSLMDHLRAERESSPLNEDQYAQPALFAVQVALMAHWRAYGVEPDAVVGHSVGEAAAAYCAGALSLEDAAAIVFHRARLAQAQRGKGGVAFAALSLKDAKALIKPFGERLAVAVHNSPESVAIAGETESLAAAVQTLEKREVFCRILTSIGFASHTRQMDPVARILKTYLQEIKPRSCRVPMISTIFGREVSGASLNADYWAKNIRQPVRFYAGLNELLDRGFRNFLEIAPHPVLGAAIRECMAERKLAGAALPSLRRDRSPHETLAESLGALYARGRPVDWDRFYPEKGPFVALPAYPWTRQSYWFSDERASDAKTDEEGGERAAPAESAPNILASLLSLEGKARGEAILHWLTHTAARLLGYSPDRFDSDRSLRELGMDSLMAAELKNAVAQELGVQLSVLKLLGGAAVSELAARIEAALVDRTGFSCDRAWSGHVSLLQQGCWLADRLYGYGGAVCVAMQAPLQAEEIRSALQSLWDDLPMLNARFLVQNGVLTQCGGQGRSMSFVCMACGDDDLDSRLGAEARQSFDLLGGPLCRAVLFLPETKAPVLLISAHEAVADARSLGLLAKGLDELLQGKTPDFGEADGAPAHRRFIEARRDYLQSPRADRDRQFWLAELAEPMPSLHFEGGGSISGGAAVYKTLASPGLWPRLRDSCPGFSGYDILFTAFQVFWLQETGEPRMPIGAPICLRKGFESAIGCFENILILRGDSVADVSFLEAARRNADRLRTFLEHKAYPLQKLLEDCDRSRVPGVRPAFQVMFAAHVDEDAPFGGLTPPPGGLEVLKPIDSPNFEPPCELALWAMAAEAGLELRFVYRPRSVSGETAAAMADRFVALLERLASGPRAPLTEWLAGPGSRRSWRLLPPRAPMADRAGLEQAIRNHPAVGEAAVRMTGGAAVAYVVAKTSIDRLSMLVKCRVVEDGERWQLGENLSSGGVCLRRAPEHWRPGHKLDLGLALPGRQRTLEAPARVVWVASGKAGLCFESDLNGVALLKDAVASLVELEAASLGKPDYSRFRLSLRMACRACAPGEEPVHLTALNLYLGGVRLENAPASWPVGARVRLAFPDRRELAGLEIQAELAWREPAAAGFVFEETSQTKAALLGCFNRFFKDELLTGARLDAWMRARGFAEPVSWRLVDQLPGEDEARADALSTAEPASAAPHDPFEGLLLSIWSETLQQPELGVDDPLFYRGAHSWTVARAAVRIQDELGFSPPPGVFFRAATVAQLAAELRQHKLAESARPAPSAPEADVNPWVVPIRVRPEAKLRLLCFSFLGGGGSVYYPLFERFSEDVEVLAVQLPGRENRILERPFTSFFNAVQALEKALRDYGDKPIAFYGHSMGGLCAFEVARQLRRRRRPLPFRLFLSAVPAPQLVDRIHQPSFDVGELARDRRGKPLADERARRLAAAALRADGKILRDYVYVEEPPLDIGFTVFGGLDDAQADARALAAWSVHAGKDFSMEMFPGGHFFPFDEPKALAEAIAGKLASAKRNGSIGSR